MPVHYGSKDLHYQVRDNIWYKMIHNALDHFQGVILHTSSSYVGYGAT